MESAKRAVREWITPVVTTIGILWVVFGGFKDATSAKAEVVSVRDEVRALQISEARQDEQLKAIASMREDIARLTEFVINGRRARGQ